PLRKLSQQGQVTWRSSSDEEKYNKELLAPEEPSRVSPNEDSPSSRSPSTAATTGQRQQLAIDDCEEPIEQNMESPQRDTPGRARPFHALSLSSPNTSFTIDAALVSPALADALRPDCGANKGLDSPRLERLHDKRLQWSPVVPVRMCPPSPA